MIYLNGKVVTPTIFPDNTSQVWNIKVPDEYAIITWDFQTESEFIHVAQLKELLDYYNIPATLFMPYLPYARQDKHVSNNTTFSLKTFAALLNSLNFKRVSLYDAHSRVALNLINNSKDIFKPDKIHGVIELLKVNLIIYPDTGAYKRYLPHILMGYARLAEKVRDENGKIIKHTIEGNVPEKEVLIVDDICDGGATFISLAKLLKEKGVEKIYLYVTHGIFSKGLRVLKEAGIERIFTRKGEALESKLGIYYEDLE